METHCQVKQHRTEDSPTGRSLRGESGVAIVEFALVLPILLLLILTIFDFGRALNYWADTTHLANEGARMAAVDRVPGGGSSLQSWLRDQADSDELRDGGSMSIADPLEVCVDSDIDGDGVVDVGDPVEVSVSTTYHWLPFLADKIDISSTNITGRATMRRERVPDVVDDGCE
jgi:TadE-like protein